MRLSTRRAVLRIQYQLQRLHSRISKRFQEPIQALKKKRINNGLGLKTRVLNYPAGPMVEPEGEDIATFPSFERASPSGRAATWQGTVRDTYACRGPSTHTRSRIGGAQSDQYGRIPLRVPRLFRREAGEEIAGIQVFPAGTCRCYQGR